VVDRFVRIQPSCPTPALGSLVLLSPSHCTLSQSTFRRCCRPEDLRGTAYGSAFELWIPVSASHTLAKSLVQADSSQRADPYAVVSGPLRVLGTLLELARARLVLRILVLRFARFALRAWIFSMPQGASLHQLRRLRRIDLRRV
jgi:hypothetical protein